MLRGEVEKITALTGETRYYEIALAVGELMRANSKVYPNVDFSSAPLYHAMGIPAELFTPIFAVSRAWVGQRTFWSNGKQPADLH